MSSSSRQNEATVVINGVSIEVEIASTKETIDKGLSHRHVLEASKGMLFLFDHNGIFKFWMKGMRFSIDIIWIGEDMRVVGIAEQLPTVPLFKRPIFYSPSSPARFVLEVNAGFCAAHNIKEDDVVEFVSVSSL